MSQQHNGLNSFPQNALRQHPCDIIAALSALLALVNDGFHESLVLLPHVPRFVLSSAMVTAVAIPPSMDALLLSENALRRTAPQPQSTLGQYLQFLKSKLGPRFNASSLERWLKIQFQSTPNFDINSTLAMLQSLQVGEEEDFFISTLPSPTQIECSSCFEHFPPFEMCSFVECAHPLCECNDCARTNILVLSFSPPPLPFMMI